MARNQLSEKLTPEQYFSPEDYDWLKRVADYDSDEHDRFVFADDGDASEACSNYALNTLGGFDRYFVQELDRDSTDITRFADVPDYGRCVVLCLRFCAEARNNRDAVRWLGYLHQSGRFVNRDAHEAARLYRRAEAMGDLQSAVNLGYLYGYGYLGEPDYDASFKQFVKVMALGNYPEAIYKVGDAYARAQVVEEDLHTAYLLYKKCYENSGDLIGIKAQAAFRLAELISDKNNEQWDIPYDPVIALHLYQLAELGMRIQIADEATWYAERLEQTLAGQDRARRLMDQMGCELANRRRLNLS